MGNQTKVTAKQQAAIDAIRAFFLNDAPWQPVAAALEAARADVNISDFERPDSPIQYLDTIVRDSYWDLRGIGVDDFTAYDAVCDC
jgi:hypothetical protein